MKGLKVHKMSGAGINKRAAPAPQNLLHYSRLFKHFLQVLVISVPVAAFSQLSLSLTMKMAVRKKRIPPSTSTPVLVSSEYCMAEY